MPSSADAQKPDLPDLPDIPDTPAPNPAHNMAPKKGLTYDLAPQGEDVPEDHHACPIGPGATDDDLPPGFAAVVPLKATHPDDHEHRSAVPDPLADPTPEPAVTSDQRRAAAAEAEHVKAWRRAWWVLGTAWALAILTTPLHGMISEKAAPMAAYLSYWIAGGLLGYVLMAFSFFKPDDGFWIDLTRTMAIAGMGAATHSVMISTQTYLMDILLPPTVMLMAALWLRRATPFEGVCLSATIYLISVLTFLVASGRLDG